ERDLRSLDVRLSRARLGLLERDLSLLEVALRGCEPLLGGREVGSGGSRHQLVELGLGALEGCRGSIDRRSSMRKIVGRGTCTVIGVPLTGVAAVGAVTWAYAT